MENEKKSLQLTYQEVIINALSRIVERMNVKDMTGCWEALRTLYSLLPPEVEKEVKDQYLKVLEGLRDIKTRTKTFDIPSSVLKANFQTGKFLYMENRELLRLFKDSLYRHGYLERSFKPSGSNEPRGS
jgi:hypothetical protein